MRIMNFMTGLHARKMGVVVKEHLPGYNTSHTIALVDEAMSLVGTFHHRHFDEFITGNAGRSPRPGTEGGRRP